MAQELPFLTSVQEMLMLLVQKPPLGTTTLMKTPISLTYIGDDGLLESCSWSGLGTGSNLAYWIEKNYCFVFDKRFHSLSPSGIVQIFCDYKDISPKKPTMKLI